MSGSGAGVGTMVSMVGPTTAAIPSLIPWRASVSSEPSPEQTLQMPPMALGSGLLARSVKRAYDAVAAAYDDDERRMTWARPVDLGLLFSFAKMVTAQPRSGVVGDVGCGTGHGTRVLTQLGLRMAGLDLSPEMIARARGNFPELDFAVAELANLPVRSASWAGAAALGTLWHCNAAERMAGLAELARVVAPGGVLLHGWLTSGPRRPAGSVQPLERWLGEEVNLELHLVSIKAAATEAARAGFELISATEREPLPHELPLRRGFLLARRR